jgi:mitochondrial cardiolipin hydrolase
MGNLYSNFGNTEKLPNTHYLRCFVSYKHLGRAVGRHGSTVADIEAKTGVYMRVPPFDGEHDSTEIRFYSPSGDTDALQVAKQALDKSLGYIASSTPLVRAELPISTTHFASLVRSCVALEKKYSCGIMVPAKGVRGCVIIDICETSLDLITAEIADILGISKRRRAQPAAAPAAPAPAPAADEIQFNVKPLPTGMGYTQLDVNYIKTQVLFFPGGNDGNDTPTGIKTFLSILRSAKSTVDVCVFTITSSTIATALRDVIMDGVTVRMITENSTIDQKCSEIHKLAHAGVATKIDTSEYLLHHKFVVIDKTLVMSGSFNYTHAAANGNHENVIISPDSALVSQYHKQFQLMWDDTSRFQDLK